MAKRESGMERDPLGSPPVEATDEPTLVVDVFRTGIGPGDQPAMIGTQQLNLELDRSWTVADVVAYVNDLELLQQDELTEYDTVCYRVEPAEYCLTDGINLQSGTKVIRLPPDAIVTERVPSDRFPRVTISAYAGYRWLYHPP